jgi:hypothetical protein
MRLCGWALAFVGLWANLAVAADSAQFQIVWQSAVADPAREQTTFELTFNRAPDFTTTDALGRPANAFQYFYDAAGESDFLPSASVVVIRGTEIRFDDRIPVRNSLNLGDKFHPHAEGWGDDRGEAPFELRDRTLTFTVPWRILGEEDTHFSYDLFALEYGELTNELRFPMLIPLPPASATGAIGLITLAAWFAKRHKARVKLPCLWHKNSAAAGRVLSSASRSRRLSRRN